MITLTAPAVAERIERLELPFDEHGIDPHQRAMETGNGIGVPRPRGSVRARAGH